MRTVTVRMRASDLAHQMAAMREWLDRHRYEPARFVCDQHGDAVDVSVEFPDDQEGEAFEPGGICVSRVVRDQVRDRLDYAFEDLGERQVKNIARPVRVYRVREGAGLAEEPAPA